MRWRRPWIRNLGRSRQRMPGTRNGHGSSRGSRVSPPASGTTTTSSGEILPSSGGISGSGMTSRKKLRDSRKLTERGSRYHNVDLMIAATAIIESCVLVSSDSIYRDLGHFEPDFRHEAWSASEASE